jgi:FkbM family methyltransferase
MPSQYKEDEFLEQYFYTKQKGFLVDVGAADGIIGSNSEFLINQYKFRGLLVEPNKNSFELLLKKYHANKNIILENVACANRYMGKVDFYVDDRDGTEQLSTLDNQQVSNCKEYFKCNFSSYKVSVVRTDFLFLLYQIKIIDFMSVDCEQYDLKVLQGIDFDRFNIKLICLEMNNDETIDFMVSKGYKLIHKTEGNNFWEI